MLLYGFNYFYLILVTFKQLYLPIDVTLIGITILDQNVPGSNGSKGMTPLFTELEH